MKPLQEITDVQAQQLMSLLRDGELSSENADRLNEYLERHPDSIDWMENLETASELEQSYPTPIHRDESIASIQNAIETEEKTQVSRGSVLLRFPSALRSIAAAAAIAVVGTVTWLGLRPSVAVDFEPNIVEFVASDIPDSSTYVYSDEESGWTVVWVDSDTSDYETQG